jgi:hypothetical protein
LFLPSKQREREREYKPQCHCARNTSGRPLKGASPQRCTVLSRDEERVFFPPSDPDRCVCVSTRI